MNRQIPAPDHSTQRLIDLISTMPDEAPPETLVAGVMHRIRPRRPSLWQRLILWTKAPLAVIAIRPLPVGVAALGAFGLLWASINLLDSMVAPPLTSPVQPAACRTVTFRLDRPSATKVAVMGSFNQWHPDGYPMQRSLPDGAWQLGLELPPGVHAYTFVIDDEEIITDPHSLWEQDDGFGHRNSMLSVESGCDHANRI